MGWGFFVVFVVVGGLGQPKERREDKIRKTSYFELYEIDLESEDN